MRCRGPRRGGRHGPSGGPRRDGPWSRPKQAVEVGLLQEAPGETVSAMEA